MSSSTVSVATPTRHRFDKLVDEQKPNKTDINTVIMDYLIKEGYPDSARKFALEANIKQQPTDDEQIQARVEIKKAIHAGQIQAAIEKINELNPEILDLDSSLHFALLRLQLIEIIRTCTANASSNTDISPAIQFAQSQLAPRASISKEFLHDLEQTMSLLVFSADSVTPQIAALLKPALRREVADRVNQAILRRQGQSVEAKIKEWVRARAWAEREARKQKKDLPARIRIGLDGDGEVAMSDIDDGMNGNGDADPMLSATQEPPRLVQGPSGLTQGPPGLTRGPPGLTQGPPAQAPRQSGLPQQQLLIQTTPGYAGYIIQRTRADGQTYWEVIRNDSGDTI